MFKKSKQKIAGLNDGSPSRLSSHQQPVSRESPSSFVRVAPDGMHLEVNGFPFHFVGANCYYLQTYAADQGLRPRVSRLIAAAAASGLTVLRIWAHSDGDGWNYIQRSATVHRDGGGQTRFQVEWDENALRGLDFVLHEAARYGVRLVLSLTNQWEEYGGLAQYSRWAGDTSGDALFNFYRNPVAQSIFENYVTTLVQRRNTISGIVYKDDPTILAWSLINEPRDKLDPSGRDLTAWICRAGMHLKSVDPIHLVTVDTEGFFRRGARGFDADYLNPLNGCDGCDFLEDAGQTCVDFASIHLYPQNYLPPETRGDARMQDGWTMAFLDAHAQACASMIRKPLVIGEFGYGIPRGSDPARRNQYLSMVLDWFRERRLTVAGALAWQLVDNEYKSQYYEEYQIAIDGDGQDGLGVLVGYARVISGSATH